MWATSTGDGDLDVIFSRNSAPAPEAVYVNDGTGTYSFHQGLSILSGHGVALGDLNGDGDLDAAIANWSSAANTIWFNGALPMSITATAPVNGDVDIGISTNITVTFDQDVDTGSISSNTFIVRGQQFGMYPGTFSFPSANTVQFNPSVDFLYGESIEVTVSSNVLSDCGVGLGKNYVVFDFEAEALPLCAVASAYVDSGQMLNANDSRGVATGDVDGDGDLDALFVNDQGQANRLHTNDSTGVFYDTLQTVGNNNSVGVSMGDLDGDGDLDAFIANAASQANKLFNNNGGGIFTDSPGNISRTLQLRREPG